MIKESRKVLLILLKDFQRDLSA